MNLKIFFVLLAVAISSTQAALKCKSCADPKYNVQQILDLLEKSKPIFADIKALSERRIDDAEMFTRLSADEQKAELEKDLAELKNIFENNGHIPFPDDTYRIDGLSQIEKTSIIAEETERTKSNIDYFAKRGADLYARVSKIRRPIMADLAGVTYEEWSSYLDDETKPIPFPLSCTLPQVRLSKAFRTQAAADLIAYGDKAKELIDYCDSQEGTEEILDLLDKSRPIFAEIKTLSEDRINNVAAYSQLSNDEQVEALQSDIDEIESVFAVHEHIPFPDDIYRNEAQSQIEIASLISSSNGKINSNIDYLAKRGSDLYGRVSKIRRPIMADLAGVTLEEWSSYLDDETKPVPKPLTCTIPYVRRSKAFRTKAAADLVAYGESKKV